MAVLDTFLKLLVEKGAERLVLLPGEVPVLLKENETHELSMPALRPEMLERISQEIIDGDGGDLPPADKISEGTFEAFGGAEFSYLLAPHDSGRRIEVHVLDFPGAPAPAPAEERLTRAVAEFASETPAEASVRVASGRRPDHELLAAVDHALALDASDIFLSSDRPVRIRRNGVVRELDGSVSAREQVLELLPDDERREEFERAGNADFALRLELSEGTRRFRVNVFRHVDGVAAALRPIRKRIPKLSELSLPADFVNLATYRSGLVLVTGAAGSGKSTTLAAIIDHINRTESRHIITIEDPVEFEHRDIKSLIHQREVGTNVESFTAGLRSALRESPDVILLGELRDLATISASLTAAETGHLVLGTLHTGSAAAAVSRIVDVFPGYQQAHVRVQLASSLRAVVSQRLVPTRDKALVPVVEKMLVTPGIANSIREAHEHHMRSAMQTGFEDGMITLERSLASLVRRRVISRDMALAHAWDPPALDKLIG